ncbi:hypothetical protein [Aerosakkonema funiforme]|uniref:Uncharacterized protein n=1 Tax=Aerosakkonema funiforme FACHB-1375 TaxID=2949571 RepID=A0A926ZGV1_9CYAN|nr:hypothetical protein [Aerosakkonema funiforme]MBD2182618.1 hypothetical protein [Aerosakkonema funiforme FACHB-1375]
MTSEVPNEKRKELLEILEMAKIAEQKAKEMSDFAMAMLEKDEAWYKAGLCHLDC